MLDRAVKSVLQQTYPYFDLIVIDDGSTDQTQTFINQKYQGHPKFHYHRLEENHGVSFSRNFAIQNNLTRRQGEWVSFLDSDDEWHSDKLEKQINFYYKNKEQNVEYNFIHSDEIWIRRGQFVNPKKKHQKLGGDLFERSFSLCLVSPSTVLIKRDLFLERGYFREDFPVCEDYDLWLRFLLNNEIGLLPEKLITKYGGHEDQLSSSRHSMDYYRVLSMNDLLMQKKDQLNFSQINALKKEIEFKINILLKGQIKHQNFNNYNELINIQENLKKVSHI